jgi:hypothetical protein
VTEEPVPPARRPRLTRGRAIALIAAAIAGTIVIEADAVVRRLAVQRTQEALADCVDLTGLEVDLGSFPAARALGGRLGGIGVRATTVRVAKMRLRDLRGGVEQVRFSLTGGFEEAELSGGEISIALTESDLTRLLHSLDVPASADIDGDGVRVRLDGAADPIELDIHAEEGEAVIALAGALAPLFHLELDLPGVQVMQIAPANGSLTVTAAIAGRPRHIACSAAEALDDRLEDFERLAALVPRT